MGSAGIIGYSAVLLLVIIATYFDLKERRIPNWLNYTAIVMGIAYSWIDGLLGAIAMLLLFDIIFLMKYEEYNFFLGFGDVKLMAAIGAWLGVVPSAIIGVAAIVALLSFKKFSEHKALPYAPFVLVFAIIGFIKEIYVKVTL